MPEQPVIRTTEGLVRGRWAPRRGQEQRQEQQQEEKHARPGGRERGRLSSAASGNVRPVEVPPGCRAGRHRASGLTETLACKLRNRSHQAEVEHLHLHLPRVLKTSDR
ncbi:hypothetical protein ACFWJ4_08895 [Kitasatospora sp. NPDC127067]|uniref:hypothetical protein n=1 Tax=Kitasatospora sp. NPDC127067 TaxID=3347126 RepID=UPI0036615A71